MNRNPGIPVLSIQDGAKELSALPKGLDASMSDADLEVLPKRLGHDMGRCEVFHLTDFHHAISYLDEVVRHCEPDNDPHDIRGWYRTVLLHEEKGVDTILRHLRRRRERLEGLEEGEDQAPSAELAAVQKAEGYLRRRRDTMRYSVVHERDLPVGSGATESTCKQFQASVKRPGASWRVPGLRGHMALRGLVLSDRFGPAWSSFSARYRGRVRPLKPRSKPRRQRREVAR